MSLLGRITFAWAITGTVAILLRGVLKVAGPAMEVLARPLSPLHWTLIVVWGAAMCFFEGYRGFQKSFSPRVVARAAHVARHPTPLRAVLAPLFSMGFFGASVRRVIGAWALLVGIVGLVLAVRLLEQPWRGILDSGVVLGLTWGIVATVVLAVRAASGRVPEVPLDLPSGGAGAVRLDTSPDR